MGLIHSTEWTDNRNTNKESPLHLDGIVNQDPPTRPQTSIDRVRDRRDQQKYHEAGCQLERNATKLAVGVSSRKHLQEAQSNQERQMDKLETRPQQSTEQAPQPYQRPKIIQLRAEQLERQPGNPRKPTPQPRTEIDQVRMEQVHRQRRRHRNEAQIQTQNDQADPEQQRRISPRRQTQQSQTEPGQGGKKQQGNRLLRPRKQTHSQAEAEKSKMEQSESCLREESRKRTRQSQGQEDEGWTLQQRRKSGRRSRLIQPRAKAGQSNNKGKSVQQRRQVGRSRKRASTDTDKDHAGRQPLSLRKKRRRNSSEKEAISPVDNEDRKPISDQKMSSQGMGTRSSAQIVESKEEQGKESESRSIPRRGQEKFKEKSEGHPHKIKDSINDYDNKKKEQTYE